MASTYLHRSSYRRPLSARRRAAAIALSVGVVALLILALLRLGAAPPRAHGGRSLSTFTVLPDAEHAAAPQKEVVRRAVAKVAPPPVRPPPLPPAPLPGKAVPNMIVLTRDEMAAADIGKMARASKGDVAAADAGDAASVGAGPNGERLYEAEWYREPPRNVLALYLPNGAPPGAWATIACRTVARYHVDSCEPLDEFPHGRGLSNALRNAAWQFLVRPPRLGGKPLVGAWVRIRFTFEAAPAGAAP